MEKQMNGVAFIRAMAADNFRAGDVVVITDVQARMEFLDNEIRITWADGESETWVRQLEPSREPGSGSW